MIYLFILLVVIAGLIDLKTYTIPNKLTVPLMAGGLVYGVIQGRLWMSLAGFTIAFLSGVMMFALSGLGGGDVKLMAAIASWVGLQNYTVILFLASSYAIVWVVVNCAREHSLTYHAKQLAANLMSIKALGIQGLTMIDFKKTELKKPIPFGFCLGLSTLTWAVLWGMS